jgi:Protein of unknown function (DUF3617)
MTASHRILASASLIVMLVQPLHPARGDPLPLQSGFYEITVRLELPHLERWAIDRTANICLPSPSSSSGGAEIPVPVLSANNPFAKCTAANFAIEGDTVQYDIVCPGRGAAKGHASYKVGSTSFAGRVAMVMGAKNMTMTEVQLAHRIGDCGTAGGESATRDSKTLISQPAGFARFNSPLQ